MKGETAERFVIFNLRLLAVSFAVVGILFIATPDGVLNSINDVGDWIGGFTPEPDTGTQFWLALAFAYMVIITAICLVVVTDVRRYRPFILVLAVGKVASSLAALAFLILDANYFVYLLNFLVDGYLAILAVWLWSLAGRVDLHAAPD